MHVTQLMAAAAPSAIMPSPLATAVVQRAGSSLVSACVTTLRSTLTGLCRELRLVAMHNTDRPQYDDCCRRTAYPALARTIRTLKGLLPSPNTTCGTRTLCHTVPGRLKYTVLQPSSTRGGGGRKAVLAGLPRYTHIRAQSGHQARASAPLPRYTKLSQNLRQRGKPKEIQLELGTPPVEQPDGDIGHSGCRWRCTTRSSWPLQPPRQSGLHPWSQQWSSGRAPASSARALLR